MSHCRLNFRKGQLFLSLNWGLKILIKSIETRVTKVKTEKYIEIFDLMDNII